MKMTVDELRGQLEDMPGEAEVRLAMQPSWPFEYSIDQILFVEKVEDEGRMDDVVYLSEGGQIGYLPGDVKEELGW